jgi:hypothetical protein
VLEVAFGAVQALANSFGIVGFALFEHLGGQVLDRRHARELEVDAGEGLQFSEAFNALGFEVSKALLLLQSKLGHVVVW